jgi:uncharacterized protein (DUF488 family)
MAGKLIPFGYLARGSQERLTQLMADQEALLVDIRFKPHSKRPEWRQMALEEYWGDHQRQGTGRYHYLGELGNVNYRSGGPIQLSSPHYGLAVLKTLLNRYNIVLLCACACYDTCHRKVVVDMVREKYPDVDIVLEDVPVAPAPPVAQQEPLW